MNKVELNSIFDRMEPTNKQKENPKVLFLLFYMNYLLLITACAAANLAIGTRKGEQDT